MTTHTRPLDDRDLDEATLDVIRAALMKRPYPPVGDLRASQQALLFAALVAWHTSHYPGDRIMTGMKIIVCAVLRVDEVRANYILTILRHTGLKKAITTDEGRGFYIDLSPLPRLKRLVEEVIALQDEAVSEGPGGVGDEAAEEDACTLSIDDEMAFFCIRQVVCEGRDPRDFKDSPVYAQAALVTTLILLDPLAHYDYDGEWLRRPIVDTIQPILGVDAMRTLEIGKRVPLFADIGGNSELHNKRRSKLKLREGTPFAALLMELRVLKAWQAQNRHE